MFNEKSSVWLKAYKVYVILSTIDAAVGGYFICYDGLWWDEIGSACGALLMGIVFYILGMVSLNLLSNIQTIREKLEEPKD